MTKSKKTSKTRQKFDFGMEPKITTLFPTRFLIFHVYQVLSKSIKRLWRRSRKCKLSNGRGTDDGQWTTRGHNTSLEPSAPVP